ncbi:MAG: glycerol-3-phosphate 1-O-acyltransferase PlsY [Alphaproteobacteria bacterium]
MTYFYQVIFLVITYLICSIPFGLLFSKIFANTDIRKLGSGNIGATNVTRILGKKFGALTFVFDSGKGMIMVIIARFAFVESDDLHNFLVLVSLIGICAHIFPIYLNFKGGKGIATTIGCLIALDFNVGMLAIFFWILSFAAFRISAVASLIAIFSTTIFSTAYDAPILQIIFCWIIFALIFYKHKENVIRILTGEEKRM